MRKAILFFTLLIISLSLLALLINAFILQKNYYKNTNQNDQEKINNSTQEVIEAPSIYVDYLKEVYDKALSEKRILVLYFTSNWCQKCIDQDLVNQEVFNELPKEGIVGLKIHILDSETTTEKDSFAQKFDVSKEQSFVILDKNGVIYFKHTGVLSKDQLKQKISEVISK